MISYAAPLALARKCINDLRASASGAAIFRQVVDFKRFFTAQNIFFISILLLLHYFLSDGTVIDFIKQLLGWIIVPFLSAFIKPKD